MLSKVVAIGALCLGSAQARVQETSAGEPTTIEIYPKANFAGNKTILDMAPICQNIPPKANMRSIKMGRASCCMFYRASCPKIEVPGQFLNFQQIIRSLHQTIVEDVADLTPTGFVGNQVRSYICPGMHICEALFQDKYVLDGVGYLGNWFTDIVDLPGRHLPDGTADLVMYKLGEYN